MLLVVLYYRHRSPPGTARSKEVGHLSDARRAPVEQAHRNAVQGARAACRIFIPGDSTRARRCALDIQAAACRAGLPNLLCATRSRRRASSSAGGYVSREPPQVVPGAPFVPARPRCKRIPEVFCHGRRPFRSTHSNTACAVIGWHRLKLFAAPTSLPELLACGVCRFRGHSPMPSSEIARQAATRQRAGPIPPPGRRRSLSQPDPR